MQRPQKNLASHMLENSITKRKSKYCIPNRRWYIFNWTITLELSSIWKNNKTSIYKIHWTCYCSSKKKKNFNQFTTSFIGKKFIPSSNVYAKFCYNVLKWLQYNVCGPSISNLSIWNVTLLESVIISINLKVSVF